jgi:hypothetical protein
MPDMRDPIDMLQLQRTHPEQWVALRGREVEFSGKSFEDLSRQIDATGVSPADLITTFVPSPDKVYVWTPFLVD